MYDTVIIGTGPSGLTTLLYATMYGLKALALGETLGGKLVNAPDIIDYPGIENIHGKEFTQHLTKQLARASATIEQKIVKSVTIGPTGKVFTVTSESDESYSATTLVLATGNGNKQKENSAVKLSAMIGARHENGLVVVDGQGKTTIEAMFAAGDCIAFPESLEQLSTAVATGIRAAAGVYTYLKNEKPPILWGSTKIPRR